MARKPAFLSVSREAIINAAADVLQQRGYEATTMKDIANAVNLTAASLYHHFHNKDSLLLAVLEVGLQSGIASIEPIARDTTLSASQRLHGMIRTHILSLTNNPSVGAAMVFEIRALMQVKESFIAKNAKDAAAQQEFIERRNHFFNRRDYFEGLFSEVMKDGIATQEFRPVDVGIFVKMILGSQNWVGVWYRPQGRLSGEQIADFIAENLVASLRQIPSESSS